jgi:hypothetical protein
MSRFSGKCDFYDEIEIFGLNMILNCEVYVQPSATPLHLTCREDCIPYYPYVVTMASTDAVRETGMIVLTAKSWVDIEEERYGPLPGHEMRRRLLQEEMERAHEKEERSP